MGARELLSDLTAAGFALAADGDKVVIRPASKLTDEVRAAIRAAKPALLVLLTQTPDIDPALTPTDPADDIEGLNDAAKARFLDRRDRLLAWGYGVEEAESIALRLARRDAEQDDRRLCIECRHLERGGRCACARAGRLLPECGRNFEPPRTLLQRCPQFEPRGRS